MRSNIRHGFWMFDTETNTWNICRRDSG